MGRREVIGRVIRFQVVAWVGTVVNLAVLYLLHGRLGVSLPVAGAAAIEVAIVHNFTWYYFTTWRDRVAPGGRDYFGRLLRYNVVTASIDFVVTLGMLWVLVEFAGVHYLVADLAGMVAAPVVKFFANEFLLFKRVAADDKRAAERASRDQDPDGAV